MKQTVQLIIFVAVVLACGYGTAKSVVLMPEDKPLAIQNEIAKSSLKIVSCVEGIDVALKGSVRKEDVMIQKTDRGYSYSPPSEVSDFLKRIITIREGNLAISAFLEDEFFTRAQQEFPDWPKLLRENRMVPRKGYAYSGGNLIRLDLQQLLWEYWYEGAYKADLNATVTGEMLSPKGEVLWRRSFTYRSRDYGRSRALPEFMSDSANLLKQELQGAAKIIVDDFVRHIKTGR